MKKKFILLILILLNLILSTSGIAQEELVTLKDTSISNKKIDVNKFDTAVKTQDQIKNIKQVTITKEDTFKAENKLTSHEIQRTTNDKVTTNNIETNTVKNVNMIESNNIETNAIKNIENPVITNVKNTETQNTKKETLTPHEHNKHEKPVTLKNIFEVSDLDKLCGYCGFSGAECISFKNYLIKNSLIYVSH